MLSLTRWLAVGLLAVFAVMEAQTAMMVSGWRQALFALFAATLVVTTIGVARRSPWARWVALGGALTTTINVAIFIAGVGTEHLSGDTLLSASVAAGLLLTLGPPPMAVHFTERLPLTSVWRRHGDLRVRAAAAAVVTAVAAVAMLLVTATITHDGTLFVALAALLGGGALLLAAERVVGLLVLGAGAIAGGLMAHALAAVTMQHGCGFSHRLSWVAAFTYPTLALAAVTSAVAVAAFAGPIARFLARPGRQEP